MSDKITEHGRLAFRHEGEWWVAYWAQVGTMEGAISLGNIRMSLVTTREARESFKETMRLVLGLVIGDAAGQAPEWTGERSAPEHEKAGNA